MDDYYYNETFEQEALDKILDETPHFTNLDVDTNSFLLNRNFRT